LTQQRPALSPDEALTVFGAGNGEHDEWIEFCIHACSFLHTVQLPLHMAILQGFPVP
jgi:hypothetical protein